MATTWANVLTLFAPNDADIQAITADPLGNQYITWATQETAGACWGAYRDRAIGLLAAHFGKAFASGDGVSGAAAGTITSESVGGMSKSYGSTSTGYDVADAELATTVYGRQFISLRDRLCRGAMAI